LAGLMQADGLTTLTAAKGQVPDAEKATQHALRLSQISVTPKATT
jgi:hypothetical protein